jgi:hypothetical protein
MVETITPVVHGGSRKRWSGFLVLHAAGATAAATAFGAALGGVGWWLGAPWGAAGLSVIVLVAALYLSREVFGVPVPVPQLRRQVPDWWRTYFPFGPASFLYGLGLGIGFFTYLSHGTLVVVSAAALIGGRPALGMVLLAPFGLVRGLTAATAFRARTPEDGSALVGSLARMAAWGGWRVVHAAVLLAVAVAALSVLGRPSGEEIGAAAAAGLALTFGAAATAKLLRPLRWRRALESYRLPRPVERSAAIAVPLVELGLAGLAFVGLASMAGLASLVALAGFSSAVVAARIRVGRRLDCGCFGSSAVRDYRLVLARNAALAAAGIAAWRLGPDAGVSVAPPAGSELLPAGLVVGGLVLALWAARRAMTLLRRGDGR